jgi:hypothetical protein
MIWESVEESALYYLSRKWSVIPLCPRGKRPLLRWSVYQYQRPGPDDVKDWFGQWPDANIGIVTGLLSGLLVLDVDPKHGGDESLAKMESAHQPLPRTVEAVTGGGGRHIYFSHAGELIRNRVGFGPGVDLRGDGGYVVAPPSMHASGKRYFWAKSQDPETAVISPLPNWLKKELTSAGTRPGHPLSYWRRLVKVGVAEGQRNNTIASFAGHLLWHGVDPEVTMELLLCWNAIRCRPPLPDEEVVRTVESIARLHEGGGGDPA